MTKNVVFFYIKIIVVVDVSNYWLIVQLIYRNESSKYDKKVEL
jgi:hypothetical protein